MASVVLPLSLDFSGVPAKCENVGRPTAVGPRAEDESADALASIKPYHYEAA
jgi:hypothetical protein